MSGRLDIQGKLLCMLFRKVLLRGGGGKEDGDGDGKVEGNEDEEMEDDKTYYHLSPVA